MSFGDHLEELRSRILWAVAVPLPLAILTFIISDPFIEWLYRPLDGVLEAYDMPRRLQALGPAEVLITKVKLSLIVALVLSGPWILWQAWLFIRPGLYKHERRFVYFLVPGSAILTASGLALMYFVMLPLMLRVLVLFGASLSMGHAGIDDPRVADAIALPGGVPIRTETPPEPERGDRWLLWPQMELFVAVEPLPDAEGVVPAGAEVLLVPTPGGSIISQEFRLTTYINFVLLLMLGIVIAFQMPLVILLLGWLGLLTEAELRAKRKYAIFVCAAVAAIITPADAFSMIMMFIPLVGLFELSILLLRIVPASAVAEGRVFRRKRGL